MPRTIRPTVPPTIREMEARRQQALQREMVAEPPRVITGISADRYNYTYDGASQSRYEREIYERQRRQQEESLTASEVSGYQYAWDVETNTPATPQARYNFNSAALSFASLRRAREALENMTPPVVGRDHTADEVIETRTHPIRVEYTPDGQRHEYIDSVPYPAPPTRSSDEGNVWVNPPEYTRGEVSSAIGYNNRVTGVGNSGSFDFTDDEVIRHYMSLRGIEMPDPMERVKARMTPRLTVMRKKAAR